MRRFDSFGFVKSIKIAYNAPLNNNDYSARNNNTNNRRGDSDSDDNDVYYETNTKNKSKNGKNNEQDLFQWYAISVPSVESNDSVKVRFFNAPISLDDLTGFNNTGNICEFFEFS